MRRRGEGHRAQTDVLSLKCCVREGDGQKGRARREVAKRTRGERAHVLLGRERFGRGERSD